MTEILKPAVEKLSCPKCSAPMKLVALNPASKQRVWACTKSPAHRVIPGLEGFKPGGRHGPP